jgi:GTP-binding protein EngB required for normal cell division
MNSGRDVYSDNPEEKNNYDIRFKPIIRDAKSIKSLGYKPNAVIAGRCGAGKTTLLNLLCNSLKATTSFGSSVTRELSCLSVSNGDHPFNLVDTPGTDSTEEFYKHAILLYNALITK